MQHTRLFALEGIDGAGTSSQIDPVASALRARGFAVTCTHEPSGGDIGQLLRSQLRAQQGSPAALGEASLALLFAADRLAHLDAEVLPALARGDVVLCDRYLWSSYAYQSAALPADWVRACNAQAPVANCNVWLECEPNLAQKRRQGRGEPPERFEQQHRQVAAHERYRQLAETPTAGRCLRIDGSRPLGEVTEAVVAGLLMHLVGSP